MTARLWASAVGLVAVLVACLLYLTTAVLDIPLFGGTNITVDMPSTGGLYVGSMVSYRGSRVGQVRSIDVTPTGVAAHVEITDGHPIPATGRWRVRSMSPVGEQYLDIQPSDDHAPYLHDGQVVHADVVDLPVQVSTAIGSIQRLLSTINTRQLAGMLTELGQGLQGSGPDLRSLLDSTSQLTTTFDQQWPQTERLLRNARVVLQIGADKQSEIASFTRDAKALTAFLRGYDPTFRRLLAQVPADESVVTTWLADADPYLGPVLERLDAVSLILAEHGPHLRALLESLGPSAATFAKAFYGNRLHLDLWPAGQPRCDYGVPHRDPMLGRSARQPVDTNGHCPMSAGYSKRGAQHAPPPQPVP